MKIAICITQSSLGGVGTSTYILASGMIAAGHDVDILGTEKVAGVDYDRARKDGWPVEAICAGQQWLRHRLETVYERLCHYDVVINNHSMETQLVLPALPARIVRLSVIRSTHSDVIRQAMPHSQWLDALVGISPIVTELLRAGQPVCPVKTIPNAVLAENEGFPVLSEPLRIVFLGRLEEAQKNILRLPDIAAELDKMGVSFILQVVGDGPERESLVAKLRKSNLGNRVVLEGALRREVAYKMLAQAHFSLIPSRWEGFGLVLAESMAVGAIPIASDLPVFRWIAGDDADSLLVPVNDARAYAERIRVLSRDPKRYAALQKSLCDRQKKNFTPRQTVKTYLHLIEELQCSRDPSRFAVMPFDQIPLGFFERLRCTRAWFALQKWKNGSHRTRAHMHVS